VTRKRCGCGCGFTFAGIGRDCRPVQFEIFNVTDRVRACALCFIPTISRSPSASPESSDHRHPDGAIRRSDRNWSFPCGRPRCEGPHDSSRPKPHFSQRWTEALTAAFRPLMTALKSGRALGTFSLTLIPHLVPLSSEETTKAPRFLPSSAPSRNSCEPHTKRTGGVRSR
jgi:hypothetical protein